MINEDFVLAQRGDKRAFERLVLPCIPRLKAVIRNKLRDEEVTDDVYQETVIKAWGCIRQFRSDSKFSTWITRIGINSAYNYDKKRRIEQGTKVFELSDAIEHKNPEKLLWAKEQRRLITLAVDDLPTTELKNAMILWLSGHAYKEIAEGTQTIIGTVRSRIHRGKLMLQETLRKNVR